MRTNAIDFINNKIELQEGLYGYDITTNLVKSWLLEFEKLELERRKEQDKFFKEFEASDRQQPDELFVPNNEKIKTELKSIVHEWVELKRKKSLIKIIRKRLNEMS
jgi:hypothetical protein